MAKDDVTGSYTEFHTSFFYGLLIIYVYNNEQESTVQCTAYLNVSDWNHSSLSPLVLSKIPEHGIAGLNDSQFLSH